MTINRLAKTDAATKRTAQEWCDFGNAKLRGEVPTVKHHLDAPRYDVHWFVQNGRPTIGWL